MDPTTTLVGHALEAAGESERLLAQNVANLDTPGYRPSFVTFASLLAQATSVGQAEQVRPTVVTSQVAVRADGNGVDADQEMVLLAEAGLRYQFLADALKERVSDLKLASEVA
jgi:flagellar basal-body rod protein FlgB